MAPRTATAVALALASALWRVIPTPPHALPLDPTRLMNRRSSLAIPTTTTATVEAMSGPNPLSATRKVMNSTMSRPRGRKLHLLRHSFPFQTFHQSSASTLLKGRPRSLELPGLLPRCIPLSPLRKYAPPKRVRISRLARFVGATPLQIMELPSVAVVKEQGPSWKKSRRLRNRRLRNRRLKNRKLRSRRLRSRRLRCLSHHPVRSRNRSL